MPRERRDRRYERELKERDQSFPCDRCGTIGTASFVDNGHWLCAKCGDQYLRALAIECLGNQATTRATRDKVLP